MLIKELSWNHILNFRSINELLDIIEDQRNNNRLKIERIIEKEKSLKISRSLVDIFSKNTLYTSNDVLERINSWDYVLESDFVFWLDQKNNDENYANNSVSDLKQLIVKFQERIELLWLSKLFEKSNNIIDELILFFEEWQEIFKWKILKEKFSSLMKLKPVLNTIYNVKSSNSSLSFVPEDIIKYIYSYENDLLDFFWYDNIEDFIQKEVNNQDLDLFRFLLYLLDNYDLSKTNITFWKVFSKENLDLIIEIENEILKLDIGDVKLENDQELEILYDKLKKSSMSQNKNEDVDDLNQDFYNLMKNIEWTKDQINFINYISNTKNDIELLIKVIIYYFNEKNLDFKKIDFSKAPNVQKIINHIDLLAFEEEDEYIRKIEKYKDDLDPQLLLLLKPKTRTVVISFNKLKKIIELLEKNKSNQTLIDFVIETTFSLWFDIKLKWKKAKFLNVLWKKWIKVEWYNTFVELNKKIKQEWEKELKYCYVLRFDKNIKEYYIDIVIENLALFSDWLKFYSNNDYDLNDFYKTFWYNSYFIDFYKSKYSNVILKYNKLISEDQIKIDKSKNNKDQSWKFLWVKKLYDEIKEKSEDSPREAEEKINELKYYIQWLVNESISRKMVSSILKKWRKENNNIVLNKWNNIWLENKSFIFTQYSKDNVKIEEQIIYQATKQKWINIETLLNWLNIDKLKEKNIYNILNESWIELWFLEMNIIPWNDNNRSKNNKNWESWDLKTQWYDIYRKFETIIEELEIMRLIWNIISVSESKSFYNIIVLEIDWEHKTIFISNNYWEATYILEGNITNEDLKENNWNIKKIAENNNVVYDIVKFVSDSKTSVSSWKNRILKSLWLIKNHSNQKQVIKDDKLLLEILSKKDLLEIIDSLDLKNFDHVWKEFADEYNNWQIDKELMIDDNYLTIIKRLWWNNYISNYKNYSLCIKDYIIALVTKNLDKICDIELNLKDNHEPTMNKTKVLEFISKIKNWELVLKDRSELKSNSEISDLLKNENITIPYWIKTSGSFIIMLWGNPFYSQSIEYIYALVQWNKELIDDYEKKAYFERKRNFGIY